MLCFGAAISLLCPRAASSQEKSKYDSNWPSELLAVDPEIRALLDEPRASCDRVNINDTIAKIEKALKIADDRGLIRDRGLIEASLASAYIYQAKLDLAFTTFQRALQDAIDSKNPVLEADVLISLAAEAQVKGNSTQAMELVSKALSISEKMRVYTRRRGPLVSLGNSASRKVKLKKVHIRLTRHCRSIGSTATDLRPSTLYTGGLI